MNDKESQEIEAMMARGILTGVYCENLRRAGYGEKDHGMSDLMESPELRKKLQQLFRRFSIYAAKPRLFGVSERFREQFAEFMDWAESEVKSDYLIEEANKLAKDNDGDEI